MPQPRDFRVSGFKGACLPMPGLDRLERTAAAGGGNHEKNMDRQDKQDRLVLHPVHPVYRCKTRIGGMDTGRLDLSKDVSRSHSKGVPPLSSNSLSGDRRGVVLVTVLWIMVGLSLLALTLAATVRTEATLARASGEAEQAYFFARGALEAVLYRLAYPDPDPRKQQALFPYAGGMNHYRLSSRQPEVPPGPHGRSRQAGLERRPPRDPGAAAEDRGARAPPGPRPWPPRWWPGALPAPGPGSPGPGGVPSASWKSCCRFPGWAGSCSTAGPAATGTGEPSFSGA